MDTRGDYVSIGHKYKDTTGSYVGIVMLGSTLKMLIIVSTTYSYSFLVAAICTKLKPPEIS